MFLLSLYNANVTHFHLLLCILFLKIAYSMVKERIVSVKCVYCDQHKKNTKNIRLQKYNGFGCKMSDSDHFLFLKR